jgi:hypothetical protein
MSSIKYKNPKSVGNPTSNPPVNPDLIFIPDSIDVYSNNNSITKHDNNTKLFKVFVTLALLRQKKEEESMIFLSYFLIIF